MYQNATMKDRVYLELKDIPAIMKKADDPEITGRDTRDLMFLLSRMSYINTRLSGHITTRKMGYASFDWEITTDDDKIKTRIRPFIKAIMSEYINAPLYGIMGFKALWIQGELGWQVRRIKKYKPIELDYEPAGDADDADDTLLIVNQDENIKTKIEAVNQDFFYYIYPLPDRGGYMRSVIIPEILRLASIIDWNNLNKRMKGIVHGTIDAEALSKAASILDLTPTQRDKMLTDLDAAMAAIGTNNYLRTLDHAKVEFKSMVEAAAGTSFEKFSQKQDTDIAIAILGQANTSELPTSGGSRAALQIMNLIRQDIVYNDMLNIKELADRALLVDFQKNMDPNAVSTEHEFKWKMDENADIEAYARVFEMVGRSTSPIAIGKKEYYNKLGLSVPDEAEETIMFGGATAGPII